MKKMFRSVAVLLCLSLLFSCFSMTGFAAAKNTNEDIRFYGDIDGDGVVEESDFQYIMSVIAKTQEMPDALSAEYYAANIMGDGITMEDARRCYRYLNNMDTPATYSSQEQMLSLYNDLVSVIKSDDFMTFESISYFTVSTMHTETSNFDFGAYTDIIEGIFNEEMADEVSYTPLIKDTSVYYFENSNRTNYPMFDSPAVSELTVADLKNITFEVGVPCTFSTDLAVPQTFVRGTTTYDVTPLSAQEAQYTDCIRVTVEIKAESYKKDIAPLPADAKTAFYNFYGSDIRLLAEQYPFEENESADGMVMIMHMDLNDIRTAGKAVYYFDRATLNPICAAYTTTIDTTQNVNMEFGIEDITIKGTMDPRTVNTSTYYYWFGRYITAE